MSEISPYRDALAELEAAIRGVRRAIEIDEGYSLAKSRFDAAVLAMAHMTPGSPPAGLSMQYFQKVNAERAAAWHEGGQDWSLADWGNAMAGECGEACNVIKKMRRIETGVLGNINEGGWQELRSQLGLELADTVTYAFLTATHLDIDLGAYVGLKFNKVSSKQGLPHKIVYR